MITEKNIDVLKRYVNYTKQLGGDMAEVGVSVGDSAEIICQHKGDKRIHLFDTFEGHPRGYIGRYDFSQTVGKHKASLEDVKERLRQYKEVYFYKGIFPKTAEGIKERFCFVNLDTDLYKSTLEGLEFFFPKMVKGGIIVVHDMPTIAGVAMAVIDFCTRIGLEAIVEKDNNQAIIQC
jgi:hypothetical protein